MEIVVSTLAMMGKSAEEVITLAQKNHWALEFSSGMPYREDMESIFLNAPVKRFAHNYFPAPKVPFVLNLASANKDIRETSIRHCIHGLELSKKVGAPFFSAHAGFCVDPHPDELGRKLALSNSFDRDNHWNIFKESLQVICKEAERLGLKFLIENNVLAQINVHPDGSNPLLCCDAGEMLQVLKEVNLPSLALLIDTAHLRVSSNTLKFDLNAAVRELVGKVGCVHHSDNDGTFDTNEKMEQGYWFLPFMKDFSDIVHVIEVKKLTEAEINQQIEILKR
ncbi:MAG: sugar phosphate isomerase/epimerase family protein [Bacteroidia bacterium]